MGHAQQLRDLLAPLGVYRWEGTFQWGELQSQGAALDQVAEELADTQQEMHLATAQGEGLDRILSLLGRERGEASVEDLRATAAALLRIGGGSFTLAAMNDTLRGCGLPAWVEETGDPLKLKVIFPQAAGIPAGFAQIQARVEDIRPCHVQVEYQFGEAE